MISASEDHEIEILIATYLAIGRTRKAAEAHPAASAFTNTMEGLCGMINVTGIKNDLLGTIEMQALFRDERAAENPGDNRNAKSAAALRVLRQRIAAIAADDPRLTKLAHLWATTENGDVRAALADRERQVLRLYALVSPRDAAEVEGDAESFLDLLIFELASVLEEHGELKEQEGD
jgi:hypothetical protein